MIHLNTVYIFILLIIFLLFETKNKQNLSDLVDQTSTSDIIDARDKKIIRRQSARWSLAAKQDKNPVIGLLHANYGTAYQMFLIMNGIMEKTLFEKTVMIEKKIIIDINNRCKTSQQLINYDMIRDIIQRINIKKHKYKSNNTIIMAFQLIDLINEYSTIHSNNPLIELICANYCSGVYWAITDIRNNNLIETSLSLYIGSSERQTTDSLRLRDILIDKQDKITKKYSNICTQFNIGEIGDDYLAKIAGDK